MMRKLFLITMMISAVPLSAQNVDLSSLERLRESADNVVSITLGPELLAFANAFLSRDDEEEAAALRVTEGLESIQVRVYEFNGADRYDPEALNDIWDQLDADGWSRLVEVEEEDSQVGVWTFMESAAGTSSGIGGMAILVEEEEEVVLVNIVGSIRAEDIAALASQFDFDDFIDLDDLEELNGGFNLGNLRNFIDENRNPGQ